jgi:FkbM family methyltransferase
MKIIKRILDSIIPKKIKNYYQQKGINCYKQSLNFSNLSYSQEGEDILLSRIFEGKENGFYLDIGAHHPKRFSNTYLFYQKGWTGINIDAMPAIMKEFKELRARDINLEVGISKEEQILTYYIFNEPALNTFNCDEAKLKDGINDGQFYIIDKKEIKTYPLAKILEEHIERSQEIDFLTIDVEGLDLEVLKSNDWTKYKPKYILIEELRTSIDKIINGSEIYSYLKRYNYSLMHRTFNTSIYKINEK